MSKYSRSVAISKCDQPKAVRQSVSLPPSVASQVRTMAKSRRLSATREFFDLAERFRNETSPDEARRLGDELGRMVFGG